MYGNRIASLCQQMAYPLTVLSHHVRWWVGKVKCVLFKVLVDVNRWAHPALYWSDKIFEMAADISRDLVVKTTAEKNTNSSNRSLSWRSENMNMKHLSRMWVNQAQISFQALKIRMWNRLIHQRREFRGNKPFVSWTGQTIYKITNTVLLIKSLASSMVI